jgi:hypothetical protein
MCHPLSFGPRWIRAAPYPRPSPKNKLLSKRSFKRYSLRPASGAQSLEARRGFSGSRCPDRRGRIAISARLKSGADKHHQDGPPKTHRDFRPTIPGHSPKKSPHGFRRAGAQLDLPYLSVSRYLPEQLRNESRSGSRPSPTSRHYLPYR